MGATGELTQDQVQSGAVTSVCAQGGWKLGVGLEGGCWNTKVDRIQSLRRHQVTGRKAPREWGWQSGQSSRTYNSQREFPENHREPRAQSWRKHGGRGLQACLLGCARGKQFCSFSQN
jgi:hypothetical protein